MARRKLSHPALRNGFTLVEIVLVMLVIVLLMGGLLYYYDWRGEGKKPGDVVHTPVTKAKDVVCQTNLQSLRQMITVSQTGDPDGRPPQTMEVLPGFTSELRSCPVGHEPYQYDPTTGQIHCVHPGHENY
ncbi:MAG TPA: prepilin-type N-terminal cleavage/methylation domain-containing protein [Chthonomonadaceae bacterium]|nr:prepilin-type N-terminal cleavage/methylation domain-containing protein [Chthonomonadaceae bacterium]